MHSLNPPDYPEDSTDQPSAEQIQTERKPKETGADSPPSTKTDNKA